MVTEIAAAGQQKNTRRDRVTTGVELRANLGMYGLHATSPGKLA
jgi:hypothetical protein